MLTSDLFGGNDVYQDHTARAIAMHANANMVALESVYGAGHLAREMDGW